MSFLLVFGLLMVNIIQVGEVMIDIGKRIKELRLEKGISARNLANTTGLDPSQISKIESGISKPSLDALERICKTLNISIADFFKADSNENSREVRRLLDTTKFLSTDQLKLLNELLNSFKS